MTISWTSHYCRMQTMSTGNWYLALLKSQCHQTRAFIYFYFCVENHFDLFLIYKFTPIPIYINLWCHVWRCFYRKRYTESFNLVLLIKSLGCFFNKSALLINVNFHYLNYFGLKKGAVDLFYTYFTVPKVAINCRNIKIMKYNGGSATLKSVG